MGYGKITNRKDFNWEGRKIILRSFFGQDIVFTKDI